MPASQVPAHVLRFDAFELDVRARELRHGGKCIRLQDQPCEILQVLLERRGEVVTRDELRQRLWPDGTFVDFEHSLNAAVKRLRAALGDEADNPRFVQTVPRRGYRFAGELRSSLSSAPHAVSDGRIRLVVLPFTNLGAPEHEFFCDGLTEEMAVQIGRLGRRRIAVLARWSSTLFKGTTKRARDIGEALRADYLLEGTVRREGGRVRITAALVEASSETHLWTDTYDEQVDAHQLGVQVSVAERIARSLHVELVREDEPAQPNAQSPAYQAYIKGRYHWNQLADSGLIESIQQFEKAVALEPRFPAAWASLACAHVATAEYYREHPRVALESARRAARRALDLDGTSIGAHIATGDVHRILDWDWDRAEVAYGQALSYNPSSETAYRRLCLLLAALGRAHDAESAAVRVRELDPLCLVVGTATAWVSYLGGDFILAEERSRAVMEMEPPFPQARRVLSASLLALGRRDEAVRVLEEAQVAGDESTISALWLAHAMAASARDREAVSLVESVLGRGGTPAIAGYHLALAYVGIGQPQLAIGALAVAADCHDPAVMQLGVEPRLRPLHGDARFEALLRRLNLRVFPDTEAASA